MEAFSIFKKNSYDKYPQVQVCGHHCIEGWQDIAGRLKEHLSARPGLKHIITIDCYHGVDTGAIIEGIKCNWPGLQHIFRSETAMLTGEDLLKKVKPYVTDDPVFGYLCPLKINDYFDQEQVKALKKKINEITEGVVLVAGTGAHLLAEQATILVYADMPRREIQLRFKAGMAGNLGISNHRADFSYLYKHSFFVDWRVCDRHKKQLMVQWDYLLDTTATAWPKMATARAVQAGMRQTVSQPFRVVPFFDPGPWGGQWLKEVCDLNREEQNYAWGFDCVPEENSLLLRFGNAVFELPAINLVFSQPEELLGRAVYETFGAEFPIRFDFLDTMGGGNLSLQVHPHLAYIKEKFGIPYTQEESYYFMEAADDASVYLGLKEGVKAEEMMQELQTNLFNADKFAQKWPVKKHDHILIPPGTVHCSGANSVVLEISATPFIFTFKLWDWGRTGLDGKPRPISLAHGANVIDWNCTTAWTRTHLINQTSVISKGSECKVEQTGLHKDSFIETRRYWINGISLHDTGGLLNVLNLVEGDGAIVESSGSVFEPFIVHYAETFIVPAAVGTYTIRPYGSSKKKQCVVIKASIRKENLHFYKTD